MTYGSDEPLLAAGSPFRYACKACGRCCRRQRIALTPYEVLRLARCRAVSTTEAIARWTREAGTVLRFEGPDDACVFLDGALCSVHPHRPLACRLYPLGRLVGASGEAAFCCVRGVPGSLGVLAAADSLGPDDTVARHLAEQGCEPYIRAGDRYYVLYQDVWQFAAAAQAGGLPEGTVEWTAEDAQGWADVDAMCDAFCAATGTPRPDDPDALVDLHISAIRRAIGMPWGAQPPRVGRSATLAPAP